jgi:hypothetical protein
LDDRLPLESVITIDRNTQLWRLEMSKERGKPSFHFLRRGIP